MNRLSYVIAFTFALLSTVPALAKNPNDYNVTHLGNSAAIPSYAQIYGATHKFDVHVQGKAISELTIDLPENVQINRGIEVKSKSGREIPVTVSINGRKATVVFPKVINPGTSLSILMNGVRTPGYEDIWHYSISAKLAGMKENIPLGLARVQTYGG